ncbi:hypothetical protein [Lyngbya sp. CCY1209]|jgi:hypothetical protein|uniref:hypothetical protein n=1 Tax=Lyngbya sp. CCY1209 TaxID=2886103 RepID=UPI002D1FE8DF|nr:hypothetical protein [Lyngbya sp. CCY1209]MEB3885405.1 hypothetical protein [Lyngbya sp. CCY1209]
MMPPMKLPFFSFLYLLAQVRASANILLVEHYDTFADTLAIIPKVSLVVNAIKFACS